ncbi:hypothetical protein T11_10661 [Trichinella zimbabwensis]|uniref:Uncharacterized protein n=1 Tax=Trichinella zimbabwensis TaxID=268475 RepID=A0A0V1HDE6_9BILA|nr:hypothetical protein T11_10661 [Trichinella zimbabwensis]
MLELVGIVVGLVCRIPASRPLLAVTALVVCDTTLDSLESNVGRQRVRVVGVIRAAAVVVYIQCQRSRIDKRKKKKVVACCRYLEWVSSSGQRIQFPLPKSKFNSYIMDTEFLNFGHVDAVSHHRAPCDLLTSRAMKHIQLSSVFVGFEARERTSSITHSNVDCVTTTVSRLKNEMIIRN